MRVEGVQADQHLIRQLLVTEGLHDAGIVAGQVDHHIGATLESRFDPQHTQAGVAVNLARHTRFAVPDRGLELEHDLIAPAVVGPLDRAHVLGIQRWRHLDIAERTQWHGQHNVFRLITDSASLDCHAVLVLDDRGHRRVGLDAFQLFDELLGQHCTAPWQTRSTAVTVIDVAINPGLLREIQQRQTRRLVVTRTDFLIDQLARRGGQVQTIQPVGHVDLVQGEQRAAGRRVFRVVDGARHVIQCGVITLHRLGRCRLLRGEGGRREILTIDQVTRSTYKLWRRHALEFEMVQVLVQYRLGLAVADPLTGGQTRTPSQAWLGFQQRHLPAFGL